MSDYRRDEGGANGLHTAAASARDRAQTYLDLAGVIMVAIDVDEHVSLINRRGCSILGGRADQIVGQNWFDEFVPERQRDEVRTVFQQLIAGEIHPVEYFENPVLTRSGEERLIAWHNIVLRDEAGAITGTLSSGEDITERRRQEKALMESRENLRALLNATSDSALLIDNSAILIAINEVGARRLGSSPAELVGRHIREIMPPELADHRASFADEVIRTRSLVQFEDERAGRTYCNRVYPVLNEAGEVTRFAAFASDITEQKQTEQRLRRYEEDLRSLAAELSRAEEHERRRIAVGLHDSAAQNLAVVQLSLHEIQNALDDPKAAATLDEVRALIQLTAQELRTLSLDLSPPILYELGLEAALEGLADRCQKERGIPCRFADDGQPKAVEPDVRTLLYRGATELLANVARHARAKSAELTVRRSDDRLEVEVADDGQGFDVTAAGVGHGRLGGFGLFSIRERLRAIGGELGLESAAGAGSRIVMSVPLEA